MKVYRQLERTPLGEFDEERMKKERLPGRWHAGWESPDPTFTLGIPLHIIMPFAKPGGLFTGKDAYETSWKALKQGGYDTKFDWWATPGSIIAGADWDLDADKLFPNPYTVSITSALEDELNETIPRYIKDAAHKEEHIPWDDRYYGTPYKWRLFGKKTDVEPPRKKLTSPYGFKRAFEYADIIKNMQITREELPTVIEESLRLTPRGRHLLYYMRWLGWWPSTQEVADMIIAKHDVTRRIKNEPEGGGFAPSEVRKILEPYWKKHPKMRPSDEPLPHVSGKEYIRLFNNAMSKWERAVHAFLRRFGGTVETPGFFETDSVKRKQFLEEAKAGKLTSEEMHHRNLALLLEQAKVFYDVEELARQGQELYRSLYSERNKVPPELQGTLVDVPGKAKKLGKHWVWPDGPANEIKAFLLNGVTWTPTLIHTREPDAKAWIGAYPLIGIGDRYMKAVQILDDLKAGQKKPEEPNALPLLVAGGAAALLLLI